MKTTSPFDVLAGYRLGSRQATVELQRMDVPHIHIDFAVLKLIQEIKLNPDHPRSIVLTGTAGDGKTYLAYRILEALEINRDIVREAQKEGGYDMNGIFVDLDLSAGNLLEVRVKRLFERLHSPVRLTLICANEGKLAELESSFQDLGLSFPDNVWKINLSQRSLVQPEAWKKVLTGVLDAEFWKTTGSVSDIILGRNREWLRNDQIAEHLRCYILLPYLLGEPITVREMLSCLSYILGGGLSGEQSEKLSSDPSTRGELVQYLIFNSTFSEPEGYRHGDRSVPAEKLLWWLYRFDPGDQASPKTDLDLLVKFDKLGVTPPEELLQIWKQDLIVKDGEDDDSGYRQRLDRFMRYARRWYALTSEEGFQAYFPFRYFHDYIDALGSSSSNLSKLVAPLLEGLNKLLSNNQVKDYESDLKLFYLVGDGGRQRFSIYMENAGNLEESSFVLKPNDEEDEQSFQIQSYLETLPRRLYLCHETETHIRLPISLLLFETLQSASSSSGTFATTLWVKERDTVLRFMGLLSRLVKLSNLEKFRILQNGNDELKVVFNKTRRDLTIT